MATSIYGLVHFRLHDTLKRPDRVGAVTNFYPGGLLAGRWAGDGWLFGIQQVRTLPSFR